MNIKDKIKISGMKLIKWKGNNKSKDIDWTKVEKFVKPLIIKEELEKKYLNKNSKAAIQMFKDYSKMDDEEINLIEDEEEEEFEKNIKKIENETENIQRKIGEKIKIKLVITEIAQSKTQQTFRSVLSPFMTTLNLGNIILVNNLGPTFGMFHSSLIVGPWYLGLI
jgi:hypothetical protein